MVWNRRANQVEEARAEATAENTQATEKGNENLDKMAEKNDENVNQQKAKEVVPKVDAVLEQQTVIEVQVINQLHNKVIKLYSKAMLFLNTQDLLVRFVVLPIMILETVDAWFVRYVA